MDFEEFVNDQFNKNLPIPKFKKGGAVLPGDEIVVACCGGYTRFTIPNKRNIKIWKLRRKIKNAVKITQQ